jgi:hypothetical protein
MIRARTTDVVTVKIIKAQPNSAELGAGEEIPRGNFVVEASCEPTVELHEALWRRRNA